MWESRVFTSRVTSSPLFITRDLGILHTSQLCPQGQPTWSKDTSIHHSPSTAVLSEGQTRAAFPGSSCQPQGPTILALSPGRSCSVLS